VERGVGRVGEEREGIKEDGKEIKKVKMKKRKREGEGKMKEWFL
jgi:hypothetical protein